MNNTNQPSLWELLLQIQWPATPADKLKPSESEREELYDIIRTVADKLRAKQSELLETGHIMSVDEAIRWLGYEADRAEAGE